MADVPTKQIFGTAQTVFDSATDIGAGAFSGAGTDFNNTSDGAVPYAPYAVAMIEMPDWAAAPVAGTAVSLYGLMVDVDGTDDDTDAPSSAAVGGARFLGSWTIAAADALQRRTIVIDLTGVTKFTPYIFNGTAQNMNNDAGTHMVVKITPFTFGVTVWYQFQMAAIILPLRFNQQPQYPVKVDWNNPITRGLKFGWSAGSRIDFVREVLPSVYAPIGATNKGLAALGDGTNYVQFASAPSVVSTSYSVFALIRLTTSSEFYVVSNEIAYTNQWRISGYQSGGNLQINAPGGSDSNTGARTVNSNVFSIGVSCDSGVTNGLKYYRDGLVKATLTGTPPTLSGSRPITVNRKNYAEVANPSGADTLFVLMWDRPLTDVEQFLLEQNPWQLFKRQPQVLYFTTAAGGATHASSGALSADNAVISGSSVHSIPHPSTGALSAQSAVVAGTAAHIAIHLSTGALSAGSAVISGDAAQSSPGIVTHPSTGALSADSASIAGTASHVVNHQSSGALIADNAVVSGASIHNVTHATTGDLVSGSALIDGLYQGGTAAVQPSRGGGTSTVSGRLAKRQKLILIDTIEEVEDLIEQVEEVIKEEPKKKKVNWKKAKPAPDYGTEPQDVINRLDFYTSQLDQLRDQKRAKELKRQLDQNAAIYRQLLVKRAADAMIRENQARIREEEDMMLLLMAA